MRRDNRLFIGAIVLLAAFFVFFLRGVFFLDPDFGWHLKMGEVIAESGIPLKDPFSYTMVSFPFIDHEWLTNFITFPVYKVIGYTGLAAISALIVFLTMTVLALTASQSTNIKKVFSEELLNKKIGRVSLGPNFLALLTLAVFLPFFGVRAQVVSWFLLSLLALILFKGGFWYRFKYFVPIIILCWANLHGSFAVGIGVVSLYLFIKTVREKRIKIADLLILALCVLATFINPYGVRLWYEIWMQASDGVLRWNIVEWMPSVFMLDVAYVCLLAFSAFLILRYRKKFPAEALLIYLALLIQALFSRRHVPLWAVISFPMTTKTLNFFYEEVKGIKGAVSRLKIFYKYTWILALFVLGLQSLITLRSAVSLREDAFYPKGALVYLKANLPEGEIFSEYAWGGYLIWKLPEKKVFIDGRMPSWRWQDNPPKESGGAFDDYIDIVDGDRNYEDFFSKYKVDTVLWPKAQRGELLDILAQKINRFLAKGKKDEGFNLLKELEKDGWEKVYEDSVSVIYKRK